MIIGIRWIVSYGHLNIFFWNLFITCQIKNIQEINERGYKIMKKLIFIALIISVGNLFARIDVCKDVKVPFLKSGHHILVKARINNSDKYYNFIIDTGGLTVVDKSVAQELGLKQRGPMAKISILNLAGFEINKLFCFTTFDFNLLRKYGTPIHGIIGSNLMARFKMIFDFQDCTVIFSSDTTSLTPSDDEFLFHFRNHPVNNAPIVKFNINDKTIEGMIDTGQPYPVVIPFKDFPEYKKLDVNGSIQSTGLMVRWPNTNPVYNYLARLKSCRFGNLEITNALCLFGDPPPLLAMPLIGNDLLFQFKMIINYPKHEMLLIPNSDYHVPENQFSFGINFRITEENNLIVEGIWQNSSAEKAGIHVGDQIITFNSKKVTLENLSELTRIRRDVTIKSLIVELKNENGTRKLTLHKSFLF